MTDNIEKQFFDTFGIKIRRCIKDGNCYFQECSKCDWYIHTYPQITERVLLGLICIANQYEDYPISTNIKNIQARALRILLRTEKFYKKYYFSDGPYKKLVKQVRTLFKEE